METRVQLFSFLLFGLAISAFVDSSYAAEQLNQKPAELIKCPPLDPCKVGNTYMDMYNENLRKAANCPPQLQRCQKTTAIVDNSMDAAASTLHDFVFSCPLIANQKDLTALRDFEKLQIIFQCVVPSLVESMKAPKKMNLVITEAESSVLVDTTPSKAKVSNETTIKPVKSVDEEAKAKIIPNSFPLVDYILTALKNNHNLKNDKSIYQ